MSIKKIVITGGRGFIGTNLIKYLLSKNFEIHNFDKISYCSVPDTFTNFPKNRYFFYKINLSNKYKIEKTLLKIKPQIIINLAADSHVDKSIESPSKFFANNVGSCLNLLESIRKNKKELKLKKIIHISTDEVFGGDNKFPSKEDDKYETNSPYSASKASCDHLCRAFFKTYKIPSVIIHCCNNYGPFQFTEKFIPTIISKYINNQSIPLYGSGKNIREWIYVEDLCSAIFKIIRKGKIGEKYNIGTSERISNIEIIKIILKILSKYLNKKDSQILVKKVKDRPGHDFKYQINSNKIRKKILWKNKYNLKIGLEKTVYWYLQNKKWLTYCSKIYKGGRQGLLKND
jgi:dTDP-glucose 4,6-dehydratase